MKSNGKSAFGLFIIIIMVSAFIINAHDDGQKGRTKKSTDKQGCTCHGDDPDPSVKVTISGPDELQTNMEGTYTVTITGGPLKAAGTDIAVSRGKLSPSESDLKLMSMELSHTAAKKPAGDKVVFKFTYKAPLTTGTETIYACGNSVDLNDKKTGDKWNYAPDKMVKIVEGKK
jgi:hypothetical protein